MSAAQIKNPAGGNHRAGENESQTPPSYPARHHAVKLRGSVLKCGDCPEFREKVGERGRRHCAYEGVIVRATDACIVDPLTGDFLAWLAEEERRAREVVSC